MTVGAEALEVAYAVVPGLVQRSDVVDLLLGVYNFFAHLALPLCARSNDLLRPVGNLAPVRAAKVAAEQGVVVGQFCILTLQLGEADAKMFFLVPLRVLNVPVRLVVLAEGRLANVHLPRRALAFQPLHN